VSHGLFKRKFDKISPFIEP